MGADVGRGTQRTTTVGGGLGLLALSAPPASSHPHARATVGKTLGNAPSSLLQVGHFQALQPHREAIV